VTQEESRSRTAPPRGRQSTPLYAPQVTQWAREDSDLSGADILRRIRLTGYRGGKSALYELVRRLRVGRAAEVTVAVESPRGWTSSRNHKSMISQVRQPAPHTHLPLRQLALCLDCDECFGIGPETCPSCGSATWTSLARFLAQASSGRRDAAAKRHDDPPPETVRQLIIVAGDRAHLYEHLKRGFAGNGTVRVLLNRRVRARRARSGPYEGERRQTDRRLPSKGDALLRAIGWAIVPLNVPKNHHRDSALE
jgi:hypothetical protein